MKKRKGNDEARLLQLMREFQPHACVLLADNLLGRHLSENIFEVIFEVVEEHHRDLAEGFPMIKVVYRDEYIPSLCEDSRISQ
ncbi:hypothetical protein M758_UG231800 [Ceratodon purpureus]|nr:hypothetical protein M758_UG231800 [Ceratodon purpureus]